MSRHEDRGTRTKTTLKKAKRERKQRKKRGTFAAQNASYDCDLEDGKEMTHLPMHGFAARCFVSSSHWVDEDDVD